MARISIAITVEGKRDIQIVNVLSVDDIDNALGAVKNTMSDMLKKHDHQKAYQDVHHLKGTDILQDFNGDALYIAIGIRNYNEESFSKLLDLPEDDIRAMEKGLVKPSESLCERFSYLLEFPIAFFVSDIKYHEPQFICSLVGGYT